MGQIDVAEFEAFITKHNYTWWTQGAEKAWFLIEGKAALDREMYIAALLCYVTGIEACLRTTLKYHRGGTENDPLDNITLCNKLLKECMDIGLSTQFLAFPTETDFITKIQSKSPDVEIVALRHEITHGNFTRFYRRDSATGRRTFHPSHVKDTAIQLQELADTFVKELRRFMDK